MNHKMTPFIVFKRNKGEISFITLLFHHGTASSAREKTERERDRERERERERERD